MSKIDFDLYQVKPKNRSNVIFCSLSLLKRLHLAVERANYEKVYSGTVETETSTGRRKSTAEVLESLYQRFNFCHPADYRDRSMSVSDVVVLHENGRETAHFCDDIGFVDLPQFLLPAPMVNLETRGLSVDGHFGTWHTIATSVIDGKDYFLMEHDEYGSGVANVVVDENGKLVAEDLWHGIPPEIARMISEEQAEPPTSVQEREAVSGIAARTQQDKRKPDNYLKNAEEYLEENYDCIDGRISTQSKLTPGDDTESHPEFSPEPPRPSILTRLKEKQAEVQPPASKSDTPKRDAPTLD